MRVQDDKPPAVQRQITPKGRELIAEAWADCLTQTTKIVEEPCHNGTPITNLVLEEIRGQMEKEGRYLTRKMKIQINLEIGAVKLPAHLEEEEGFQNFIKAVEEDLLNGWPFEVPVEKKQTWKRHLDENIRQRILQTCKKTGCINCEDEVASMLWIYLLSRYCFEDESSDKEVHDIFNELMEDFTKMDSDEFFAQFEEKILNHSQLKDFSPTQDELLFG